MAAEAGAPTTKIGCARCCVKEPNEDGSSAAGPAAWCVANVLLAREHSKATSAEDGSAGTTGAWRVGSYADDPFKVTTVETLHDLRGHQYDLRITFIPVDWMDVLNKFKLNTLTYVIFYFVIDAAMVILIM